MASRPFVAACVVLLAPPSLPAQTWNGAETLALVERAIARRAASQTDGGLEDYRARAHGFVFFLGQLGEGLAEPPRLIKSDELVLEVYWRAPGYSKQRIIGWRDRRDLPTDIQYHRDHLGIIQNNFADRIRLGHGEEVHDVPHPLAPGAPALYDYALADSIVLRLPRRTVAVHEILVRPKELRAARVVGRLYLDVATADLVVFRFNFTRAAYRDDTVEDITVVLENGLWEGRWWLPRRQEIEIRRRSAVLDLPARGIIRGRWEIEDYAFNLGLADTVFWGPEIVAVPRAERDTFPWRVTLETAVREVAGPVMTFDLEVVRAANAELAGARALSGLASARPRAGAISDLVRFNRVEGLALGGGWVLRPGGTGVELAAWGSYGLSDHRLKAQVDASLELGRTTLAARVVRRIRDVADEPIVAPVVNSIMAQEAGRDYGDYALVEAARVSLRRGFGPRGAVTLGLGIERAASVEVRATPARGSFRPNPPLGTEPFRVASLTLERRSPELTIRGGASGQVALEAGAGDTTDFVRVLVRGRVEVPVGTTALVARGWAGWGSRDLPAYRSFVLGGRGTLVGERFRAWGGRHAGLLALEWRLDAPAPALPLGPFVTTGRRMVVAPFVAAGWAGGPVAGVPWAPSDGGRPVVGVALEWPHRLIRAEVGVSLRDPAVEVIVDVRRDLWGIL